MRSGITILFICMFVVSSGIHAQEKNKEILNERVSGIIESNNVFYLVTDKGLLKINSSKDPYEEYYRQVYDDSTITNPNTVIPSPDNDSILNFINPVIDLSKFGGEKFNIPDGVYLYDFMQIDSTGQYRFVPGVMSVIADQIKHTKTKPPKGK